MARPIASIIKDIGFGFSQLRTGFYVNGCWFAHGAEMTAISAITKTLIAEWSLGSTEAGLLASVVYTGTLIGTLFSGFIGDVIGRRFPILWSYPVIIIFSLLSTGSQGVKMLLLIRLFVGLGFGLGQPNAVTLLVEVTPPKWRIINQCSAQLAFAFGEVFCCFALLTDDVSLKHVMWRFLLIWCTIPAAVFLCLSWAFLRESPEFLATENPEAAKEVLDAMAKENGVHVDVIVAAAVDPKKQAMTAKEHLTMQFRVVFSSSMLLTTVVLCWTCFCYNLTLYGFFFAFPQVLPNLHMGISATAALLEGALFEIPCDLFGALCAFLLPRKPTIALYFFGQAASAALFVWASRSSNSPLLFMSYYGLKGFPQIGSIALYIYIAELYPVEARATGTAIVFGVGRVGAILSSVIYSFMENASGSFHGFFYASVSLTLASMIFMSVLPETHKWGFDDAKESEPLVSALPP